MLATKTMFIMFLLSVAMVVTQDFDTEEEQESYLRQFHYLGDQSQNPLIGEMTDSKSILKIAVQNFQDMAGLNGTGEVDDETKRFMRMPRCGMADQDKADAYTKRRKKRYALGGSKWDKKELTYYFKSYTSDLNQHDVRRIMRDAFDQWQINSGLTFRQSSTPNADILISFASKEHGDGNPFDGTGKVLAHAFYPSPGIGGDAHFDEDEAWTDKTKQGTNFYQVAVHELGHSLGLSHSKVKGAIMQAFYQGYVPNFKLHSDDIYAIQALYGKTKSRPNTTPKSPNTPTIKPRNRSHYYLCQIKRVDAITSQDDKIMVFAGSRFFVMNGYGHDIRNVEMFENRKMFLNLPTDPVTLATVEESNYAQKYLAIYTSGKVTKYYLNLRADMSHNYVSLKTGYPRSQRNDVSGFPSGVTAGFRWKQNRQYYYFKGKNYYRKLSYNPWVDRGYPKSMKIWKGVPFNIDAVFSYNPNHDASSTFFFKGNRVYNFDEAIMKVNPRFGHTLNSFFGCESARMGSLEEWVSGKNSLASTSFISILTTLTALFVSLVN